MSKKVEITVYAVLCYGDNQKSIHSLYTDYNEAKKEQDRLREMEKGWNQYYYQIIQQTLIIDDPKHFIHLINMEM